jgi:hypothetical protein
MPLEFLNDPNNEKYKSTYFETFSKPAWYASFSLPAVERLRDLFKFSQGTRTGYQPQEINQLCLTEEVTRISPITSRLRLMVESRCSGAQTQVSCSPNVFSSKRLTLIDCVQGVLNPNGVRFGSAE